MKQKISVIASVFSTALFLSVTALIISTFKNQDNANQSIVASGALMITSVFGIYYLLEGCKKGIASKFYVCFMGFMGLSDLLGLVKAPDYPAAGTILMAISVAACTLLCFAKDLGQKKSYIFVGIAFVAKIVIFIMTIVMKRFFPIQATCSLIQILTAIFMVYAKYFDKAQRGSK